MASTQSKRQKLAGLSGESAATAKVDEPLKEGANSKAGTQQQQQQRDQQKGETRNSFGVDVDDLTDDTDSDDDDDYDLDEENGDADQNGDTVV